MKGLGKQESLNLNTDANLLGMESGDINKSFGPNTSINNKNRAVFLKDKTKKYLFPRQRTSKLPGKLQPLTRPGLPHTPAILLSSESGQEDASDHHCSSISLSEKHFKLFFFFFSSPSTYTPQTISKSENIYLPLPPITKDPERPQQPKVSNLQRIPFHKLHLLQQTT